jgi:hypothetical protein
MGSLNAHLKLESYGAITLYDERLKTEVENLISHLRGIAAQSIQSHERTVCEALAVRLWERLEQRGTMGVRTTQTDWHDEISESLSNG